VQKIKADQEPYIQKLPGLGDVSMNFLLQLDLILGGVLDAFAHYSVALFVVNW